MKTTLMSLSMVMGCLLGSSSAELIHYVTPPPPPPTDEIVFTTVIQDAIDIAEPGDVIRVAPGTYREYNIDLMGKAITVQSENPSDPAKTVIDCQGCMSGFICIRGETASTIIEGFTIIHSSWGSGGAFVCMSESEITFRGSSPTIRNCIITNNFADSDGAGLYCDDNSNPVVENCTFMINTSGVSGGTVSISGSNPVFYNCQFVQNSSGESGGAISIYDGNPIFTNCQFVDNSTLWWGGAVYAIRGSPVFRGCVFAGNFAMSGGALYFENTIAPEIVNCTMVDNLASDAVSGIYVTGSSDLKIENSIFWGNATSLGAWLPSTIYVAGQDQTQGDKASIAYCDIQNFASSVKVDETSSITMNNETILDADPEFVKDGSFTETGEYVPGKWHLQKTSPCINAGDPAYMSDGTDIDGEDRVMNGRIEIGVDEVEMAIAAKINIVPGKLFVPSKGFVLAMIRLPEGYSVKDINAKKILWNNKLAARCVEKCRYNAVAVFDLAKVSELLDDVEGKVEITITGQMVDGTAFAGSDTVQVNQIHWKDWLKRLCHSARKK